jgi:hypothetical protein
MDSKYIDCTEMNINNGDILEGNYDYLEIFVTEYVQYIYIYIRKSDDVKIQDVKLFIS